VLHRIIFTVSFQYVCNVGLSWGLLYSCGNVMVKYQTRTLLIFIVVDKEILRKIEGYYLSGLFDIRVEAQTSGKRMDSSLKCVFLISLVYCVVKVNSLTLTQSFENQFILFIDDQPVRNCRMLNSIAYLK
jgi:hypothetical protein